MFDEYLTFDDVLLLPNYSDFSRSDIDLTTKITNTLSLKIPFIAAPMDTVCDSKLAIALGKLGGIGIIHRNLTVSDEAEEVKKVKAERLIVGAAIGVSKGYEERIKALVKTGLDIVVVDSAHGHTKNVITVIRHIKTHFPKLTIIGGSVATYEGANMLIKEGVDALRVGMGPGSICTTRIISGMGVPQLTAIIETVRAAKKSNIPVIADGGIKYSGDIVKALAAGASAVMMGSIFAAALEAPGDIITLKTHQVPARFKHILKPHSNEYKFKQYRGMGSMGAMKTGAEMKVEDEFHGKDYYKEKVLVAEGVEGLVPAKGPIANIVNQLIGGIKSGMFYIGVKNINELQKNGRFVKITQASLVESYPHDIFITEAGENY